MSIRYVKSKRYRLLVQLVPVVLIVVCLVLLLGWRVRIYKNCTEEATAQVVSYREKRVYNDEFSHLEYIPTVKYQVNGVWYQGEPAFGAPAHQRSVGNSITVRYNPKSPEEYCIPDDSELLLCAGAIAVVAIYVLIDLVRDKLRRY